MLLDQRHPKAPLTRSQLTRGITVAGRQMGQRWYEDPAKGGDPPADPAKPESASDPDPDPKPDEPLGEAGKAALEAERDARRKAERELKKLQQERDKAAEEETQRKGEWEKLATDRQERIKELEGELATRDRQALRDAVAAKHGLVGEHAELADFITAETEEEMTAQAKTLAARVLPKKAADTEAGKRGGAKPDKRPEGDRKSENGAVKTYSWMPAGAVTIPDD